MFAVVSSGGKQYRMEPGSTILVDRLASEPGASITFDRVLLIGDGDQTTVGTPVVAGASVTGTVLGEELGPKLVIFKFKQKVKYRRRTGHRQHLTRVRIDEISADGTKAKARAAKADATNVEAAPAKAPGAEEAKPKRAARTRTAAKREAAKPAKAAAATVEDVAEKPKRRTAKPKAEKPAKAEE